MRVHVSLQTPLGCKCLNDAECLRVGLDAGLCRAGLRAELVPSVRNRVEFFRCHVTRLRGRGRRLSPPRDRQP